MGTTSYGWLSDAWDAATGTFKDWIDYDNLKFEQKMAEDRYRWEQDQAKQTAPSNASWGPVSGSSLNGKTVLIGTLLVGAAFLAYKKLA